MSGLDVSIGSLHHPKETSIRNFNILDNDAYFVYGKANRATQFNFSYFTFRTLASATSSSPSLHVGFEIGPTLVMTRPVYVFYYDMDLPSQAGPQLRQYTQQTHMNPNYVLGDAGWIYGFKDVRFNMGLHLGISGSMDHYSDFIAHRFKIGVAMDLYPKDLNIMYDNQNQVFSSVTFKYLVGAGS